MYPPEAEREVLREWRLRAKTLEPDLSVRTIDVLPITSDVVGQFGAEALVAGMADPMPGSDPTAELGEMWTKATAFRVRQEATRPGGGRPLVVLERLAALYPASSPRAVMQVLWDSAQAALEGPVVLLIPGVFLDARVYLFVGKVKEFMYRGDIL